MKIKELGLEELSVSEKKETKGGVGPLAIGLAIAGLFVCQSLYGSKSSGGSSGGGFVP